MKFTYNGMEIECTVEEFMKIAGGGGGEAKDVSLTLSPVELDKEVIDKLFGLDEDHQHEDDNKCHCDIIDDVCPLCLAHNHNCTECPNEGSCECYYYNHDPIKQDPINPANNKTESEPDDGLPPCSKCCLCKVYCDTKEDRLCEDKDGTPCPNYNESSCAYRNGVLTKDLTEKLIFGEDQVSEEAYDPNFCAKCELCSKYSSLTCYDTDGNICPNCSEYGCARENGVLDKFKAQEENPWPYKEARRTINSILEAEFLFTTVDYMIDNSDDPGYKPGHVVILCPKVNGVYKVYDDVGYVMEVDDLLGFVRKVYHAGISMYNPYEITEEEFAQEIDEVCAIVAAEEIEKILKQR